jgi:hypothetical protein
VRTPTASLLGVIAAAVCATGASCNGGEKKACIALGRRVGEAPLLSDARPRPPQLPVLLTSGDPDRPGVPTESRAPEFVVVGLPPDLSDEERQRVREERLDFSGGKYQLEPLDVKEETPPVLEVADDDPAQNHPEWALELIGYDAAVRRLDEKRAASGRPSTAQAPPGTGVVIGHPDTGHTFHQALGQFDFGPARDGAPQARIRPRDGYGFRDCNCNTYDLELLGLMSGLRDPRHGTATSSVIVGPYAHTSKEPNALGMRGVAPGAELIPLRTNTGVIIGEARALQLAMAIRHAVSPAVARTGFSEAAWTDSCIRAKEECRRGRVGDVCSLVARPVQVISISLGGPRDMIGRAFPFLEKAMRLAEAQGVIVVAAAGQGPEGGVGKAMVKAIHGSGVVYPGAFESAIGVAASNIKGKPWAASFRGPEVDVTAPGEGVWNAKFLSRTVEAQPTVAPGKGTSFSTAVTAGVAAMWLDYHGRDALAAAYGPAAIPSVFKWSIVNRGFSTPAQLCERARAQSLDYAEGICQAAAEPWNTQQFGPGMLDVDKLLAAALPTKQELCTFVRDGIGGRWKRSAADAAIICPGA